jgi:hypothetical protein
MQMIGNRLHIHVAIEGEMTDGNQDGVFDTGQPDLAGVAIADRFVARHEGKDIMHEFAKIAVGAVVEQFGTGHRQGQRSLGPGDFATTKHLIARRLATLGLGFLAWQGASPESGDVRY